MLEIKGKINTAICYASVIEEEAVEQIRRMCDYEFTEGSRIRIMPDVHAGKGCTIGTTMNDDGNIDFLDDLFDMHIANYGTFIIEKDNCGELTKIMI